MENRTSEDVYSSRLFFALPISGALGFKIFSNVALRVKSLPIPGVDYGPIGHGLPTGGELSTNGNLGLSGGELNTPRKITPSCSGISLPTVKTFFFAKHRFLQPNFDLV